MDDCRWIPMTLEHLTGEWHELYLGCRYIGPECERTMSRFPVVTGILRGAAMGAVTGSAHQSFGLHYLPAWLSPFHYRWEVPR